LCGWDYLRLKIYVLFLGHGFSSAICEVELEKCFGLRMWFYIGDR